MIQNLFIKMQKLLLLVYDIANEESFEYVKKYWYQKTQENGYKNIILGVGGNKSDLYEEEVVPESETREFAKSIGTIFGFTYERNNTGIIVLFTDVAHKYLDLNFQQAIKSDKEEENKDGDSGKITLEKKDVQNEPKKKKKRLC